MGKRRVFDGLLQFHQSQNIKKKRRNIGDQLRSRSLVRRHLLIWHTIYCFKVHFINLQEIAKFMADRSLQVSVWKIWNAKKIQKKSISDRDHTAVSLHSKSLLNRALTIWNKASISKKLRDQYLYQKIQEKNRLQLEELFWGWRERFQQRQVLQELQFMADKDYRSFTLKRTFKNWRGQLLNKANNRDLVTLIDRNKEAKLLRKAFQSFKLLQKDVQESIEYRSKKLLRVSLIIWKQRFAICVQSKHLKALKPGKIHHDRKIELKVLQALRLHAQNTKRDRILTACADSFYLLQRFKVWLGQSISKKEFMRNLDTAIYYRNMKLMGMIWSRWKESQLELDAQSRRTSLALRFRRHTLLEKSFDTLTTKALEIITFKVASKEVHGSLIRKTAKKYFNIWKGKFAKKRIQVEYYEKARRFRCFVLLKHHWIVWGKV
jgi:hypothetical protein